VKIEHLISDKRIVVLIWKDAELNALSDQYTLSLKHCLKFVYVELILDDYKPYKTSIRFFQIFSLKVA
jgi:hypothetical protein